MGINQVKNYICFYKSNQLMPRCAPFPIRTMGNPDLVIRNDQAAPSANTLNCVEELLTSSFYTHYYC